MPRRQRQGICVYCAEPGPVTRDHVPPKCLFPIETRINLITVDACQKCHDTFKLDDEYFRVVLSVRLDLPANSSSSFLIEQTGKSLHSADAKGLRNAMRSATSLQPIHGKDGAFLGHWPVLKVDVSRIVKTSDRIVRGLFPKLLGSVLPANYDASALLFDLQKDDSALKHADVQECLALVFKFGVHRQFGNVLDVYALSTDDDALSSMWFIRLHGVFEFVGYTHPRDA